MKKIKLLMMALIMLAVNSVALSNERTYEEENLDVHVIHYHVMIYNHSSRNAELRIKNYKSDFGKSGLPYIRYKNNTEKYLRELPPGECAELVFSPLNTYRKSHSFNLVTNHWMCERSNFTYLDQRISLKKGTPKPTYFHDGQVVYNNELGNTAASGIVFTHETNYDQDDFHKEIVKKMKLNPDKGFGKALKHAVKFAMTSIGASGAWGSYSSTNYYYQLTITDEQKSLFGDYYIDSTPSFSSSAKTNI